MILNYIVKQSDFYNTINDILIKNFEFSNRLRTKLIKNHKIFCNNQLADTRNSIKAGDVITIDLSEEEDNSNIISTDMNLNILYEDEWFLVLNKPPFIPIHPSSLHYTDSLSNGVKFYFNQIGLKKKIRPVNRLDLNTSGIVIFAKCEYIQEQFAKQMLEGVFQKEYLCIATGILNSKSNTIELPIARKSNSIIERCVSKQGKPCITHYQVLKEFDEYSLVTCQLKTGRTHQIRVHFSAIGHPLLGDSLYGKKSDLIDRQALHSYKIQLVHPISKQKMMFECDLPSDMKNLIY